MAKAAPHGPLHKVTLNLYAEDVELAKVLFPRSSVGGWTLMVREIIHAYLNSRRKTLDLNSGDLETDARTSDTGDRPEDSTSDSR